jgi:hypothetical protein
MQAAAARRGKSPSILTMQQPGARGPFSDRSTLEKTWTMRLALLPLLLDAGAALATDPCSPDPCVRGTCSKSTARYSLAQYFCACPVGHSGVNCEIMSLVAPCFSSDMVLQSSSTKTSIYGDANATTAGDTVTVSVTPAAAVGGRSPFTATAGKDGSWIVALGEMAASTTPLTIDVSSKSGAKQTLENILVGSVFVCSGQSNMALPVSGGYLPLTADEVYAQAKNYPHIRLLNNGHFWPPTPSHPGGTALGKQIGDAPGWQLPSYGNGSTASPGTVANFSAACWFMGTTISKLSPAVPVGLISTDAGGTSIHRWVSQAAASKCSQVTPTSTQSMGADIGTLFDPMVLPLAKMAVSGFTWCELGLSHVLSSQLCEKLTCLLFVVVQIKVRQMSARPMNLSRWEAPAAENTMPAR